MVFALVFARGTVLAFDNPARQAFVSEIVGADRVVNAVALNSVIVHSSRIAGPAAAGALIALLGVAACFAVNAATFVVMIVALRLMDPAQLHRPERAPRAPGQLRAAFAYVASTPALRVPLAMMVLVGTVSFNFQVLLPLLASETWDGTAATYALLTAVMGVGSVLGALAAGARGRVTAGLLVQRRAVRRRRAARRDRADAHAAGARADPARRGERDVRRRRELLAPARRGADAARPRDGPLRDRLPRLDGDRRAADRLARPGGRTAQRAVGRRGRGADRRGLGAGRVRDHAARVHRQHRRDRDRRAGLASRLQHEVVLGDQERLGRLARRPAPGPARAPRSRRRAPPWCRRRRRSRGTRRRRWNRCVMSRS